MHDGFNLQDMIDSKILDERKVLLWGAIDDGTAKKIVERLLYLEMQDAGKEIQMIINSPGGHVTSGFAIYDAMNHISSPISTICTGLAASMGSILLSNGEKGKRFILPHARVMIHQPSGGAIGSAADIEIQMDEILKTRNLGAKVLADNCGQTIEKVKEDFNRDYWMSAEESVEYGIVDNITKSLV